ncbi:DEAD-box ATP-dependent RNA helicase ISE2, chloroplastic [Apostasia shenzhenica]|uniref:DEAD-box ATP-dependent RNA helicase ISE2, chloroplastic n=1 Tax=Apostasia shenzhenica TaxID=1088818 RepID=A0A2I0A8X0_9ASPA|nr:DEAD-box ATP-dependent RNA helicase ISE2, chloroplastic [Apostasia shenzhenica]
MLKPKPPSQLRSRESHNTQDLAVGGAFDPQATLPAYPIQVQARSLIPQLPTRPYVSCLGGYRLLSNGSMSSRKALLYFSSNPSFYFFFSSSIFLGDSFLGRFANNFLAAGRANLKTILTASSNDFFSASAKYSVSFTDPVAVRHSLAIISDVAARDPYSVAMALGALQDILHLHDVLARVSLARLCYAISRARSLDERPDIKSQFSSILYQLLLDPSDRVCFEAILCVLGKFDNTERTEERAAGWIRLTREILKLPEAPSVSSKDKSEASLPPKPTKEKASKTRRPQPLIKLVMRRLESSFRSFSRPVLHAAARVVLELGRSRAAAYALGAYDIDEGTQLNTYSDNVESIDSDVNDSSLSEASRKTSAVLNGAGSRDTIASLLASLMEVVRTTVACECVYVRGMVIKALIWMQNPHESFDELRSIIASELSDPATPDMAVTLLEIARIFATKVPGKIDADVLQLLWKTCLVGAGPDGKHTALEAVTIVLDLPPPQPGSMSELTSVDGVSASDPKSALALQRLVQAAVWFLGENANYAASEYAWESATPPGTALMMLDADKMVAAASSRNPTLVGALTRLQRCAFSGSWEVRIVAVQALITLAIRSGEPYRLQIYEFLHALAQGGVQSQFSDMKISNGEDQGASGTGLGSLISPMLRVLDEMYRAQDELLKDIRNHDNQKQEWTDDELKILYESHEKLLELVSLFCFVPRAKYLPLGPTSAKLIEIYRNRHNINASAGLNDPAVATGISDLIYESKATPKGPDSIDPDLAMAWAANLGDGMWESNAPAMDRVNEFLTGAGTDAPEVEEENITSRPSATYDDMWAKTLLETYEAEEEDAKSSGTSSPDSTGSIESSISSHFGGMGYPSLFSSRPSGFGVPQPSIREEPPPYSSAVMQRYESFENPLAGQSFGSHNEENNLGNPQFGKALYDFTAGGDDELSLDAGEEVEIDYEVDGWYYVKKKRPGRDGKMAGLVPVLYPPPFPPETKENIKNYLEETYLLPGLDHNEFSAEKDGRFWEVDWFDRAKVPLEPSVSRSTISPVWELPFRRSKNKDHPQRWDIKSVEIDVVELLEGAQDCSILPRMPGPAKDFVRGSINNRPFRPGGLDDSQSPERSLPEGALNGDWTREIINGGVAQSIPPSFKKGLDLGHLKEFPCQWKLAKEQISAPVDLVEEKPAELSIHFDDLFKKAWEQGVCEGSDGITESKIDEIGGSVGTIATAEHSALDEILSTELAKEAKVSNRVSDDKKPREREVWASPGGNEEISIRFHELVPEMALDYPFVLDKFQKENDISAFLHTIQHVQAIYYLEKGESVFVAAHTSAGKTVVAEYAFALASKHCTRAVYTAPIKTISNQKYRDFCGKFDVGLLTGDVSLRPEASCLIMTTEILRSMLYRGADIIRDIEWVIFDEVHYVNDVERGVVWEEVIIMLPRHVNIVLLSATVPNTTEFADWIGRTKQKKIHVLGTSKRPVPLEHCLFYSGEIYKVCDNEAFLPQGLKAAKEAYKKKNPSVSGSNSKTFIGGAHVAGQSRQRENVGRGKGQKHSGSQPPSNFPGASGASQNYWGQRKSESSLWLLLINKLLKKSLLPVVIFCFSKNRCDKSADNMMATDLTSSSEKSEINIFCNKAFSRLKGSDRNLPQIVRVQSLLRRGIGVHHAGLLPIVKEVVEMLFCRGVVKVVFDALRKFDGKDFRQLLPGEYIQMAGRAGRRGLDDIGTVMVMCRDDIPEESDLKHVMVGKPTRLESQFRLTYTMILHLLRVEELKVEDMLKRSFAEFHAQKNLPEKEKLLLLKLSQTTKTIECIKGEPAIEEYFKMATQAEELEDRIKEAAMQSHSAQQFLSLGRVVVIKAPSDDDHLIGCILKTPSTTCKRYIVLVLTTDMASSLQSPTAAMNKLQETETSKFPQGYFIAPKGKRGTDEDYLTSVSARKGSGVVNIKLPYCGNAAGSNYEVREIENKEIMGICACKIKIDQVWLLEDPKTVAYSKTVQQLLEHKPAGTKFPPLLDPVKDLKLKEMNIVESYHIYNEILQMMAANKCHGCIKLKEHLRLLKEQKRHKDEVDVLKYQMSDEALQQMPDFQGRIDVLKGINCIDSDLVVQIKGRVACEMNSGEELICTECLFENQFEDLEPEEAVAIMSAFVFQQQNTSEPTLTPKLALAKKRLWDTAIRLGELQAQLKVAVDPQEYTKENLKFGLVEVVYEWAKGTPFSDICELTDVPEGLIVRTIVRLDETCREFKNAASIIGNNALFKKMETASNAIKRDIVFAASLYVTGV